MLSAITRPEWGGPSPETHQTTWAMSSVLCWKQNTGPAYLLSEIAFPGCPSLRFGCCTDPAPFPATQGQCQTGRVAALVCQGLSWDPSSATPRWPGLETASVSLGMYGR